VVGTQLRADRREREPAGLPLLEHAERGGRPQHPDGRVFRISQLCRQVGGRPGVVPEQVGQPPPRDQPHHLRGHAAEHQSHQLGPVLERPHGSLL
jgi:hypothetical protein